MKKFFGKIIEKANSHELHVAIRQNNYKKAKSLCNSRYKDAYLSEYWLGFTPLHDSLFGKKYEFTVLLLKSGANPNQPCQSKYWQGKPIQAYIDANDRSIVTLLAIYGADTADITFPYQKNTSKMGIEPEQDDSCQAYREGHIIFNNKQRLHELENVLQNGTALMIVEDIARYANELSDLYKTLEHAFLALSEKEACPAIKAHYQAEADHYSKCYANFYNKTYSNNSSSNLARFWQDNSVIKQQESNPLLAYTPNMKKML